MHDKYMHACNVLMNTNMHECMYIDNTVIITLANIKTMPACLPAACIKIPGMQNCVHAKRIPIINLIVIIIVTVFALNILKPVISFSCVKKMKQDH